MATNVQELENLRRNLLVHLYETDARSEVGISEAILSRVAKQLGASLDLVNTAYNDLRSSGLLERHTLVKFRLTRAGISQAEAWIAIRGR